MGWEANKKAKSSDLYPKSVGEDTSNENQVIQPFKWTRNADRSLVTVECKNGYILDSSCIDLDLGGTEIKIAHFQNLRAYNAGSGAASAGINTNPFNTEVSNEITGCSLNTTTHEFTIPAGKFLIDASLEMFYVNAFNTRLYNVTDSEVALRGTVGFAGCSAPYPHTFSTLKGVIEIASAKVYRLEVYCQTARAADAFGWGSSSRGTDDAAYSDIVITDIESIKGAKGDKGEPGTSGADAQNYKPPIGIPTFWFGAVPSYAIQFDDGGGPYDWVDYPEFDNATFKAMLTIWSDKGWMTAYTSTQFYVPDLQGMVLNLAGTSGKRTMMSGSAYAGGDIGTYQKDTLQYHAHYTTYNYFRYDGGNDGGAISRYGLGGEGTTNVYGFYFTNYPGQNAPWTGPKTTPATAAVKLIVRFE